ncbi:hypothetical protein M9H77_01574 [Catharanthus roseus]|uniref:Uncharacterized protein n=1 Tax=Catharanthus roseus TaxID=4058 RepID=A0ACC0C5W0_CATRO|nr:hypothetical protein M9H77_01574 [Catharanthus roseus]
MSEVTGIGEAGGEIFDRDDGEEGEPRPVDIGGTQIIDAEKSLGFDQSINEKVDGGDLAAEESETADNNVGASEVESELRSRSSSSSSRLVDRLSSSLERNNFPPILSSLNRNGRPRYDFIKMRENGRLQIHMVPNERPQLVSAIEPNVRLTLSFANGGANNQDDDQDNQGRDDEEEKNVNGGDDDKEEEFHGGNDVRLSC